MQALITQVETELSSSVAGREDQALLRYYQTTADHLRARKTEHPAMSSHNPFRDLKINGGL